MRVTGGIYRGRTVQCPKGVIRPAMVRVNKKPQEAHARESAVKPNPKIKPEPLEQPDQTGGETNA